MTTTTRRPRKKKGAATIAETSAEPRGDVTGTLAERPTEPVTTTGIDTGLMECLPSAPMIEQPRVEQLPVDRDPARLRCYRPIEGLFNLLWCEAAVHTPGHDPIVLPLEDGSLE